MLEVCCLRKAAAYSAALDPYMHSGLRTVIPRRETLKATPTLFISLPSTHRYTQESWLSSDTVDLSQQCF